ncbi:ferritin-like domain-containing protein [Lichenifustis flavocetrariae]|uniref:Ferritin-like domain-containing protein n=1 Tax=Lichenifustis flavocetrariae TaxID=2949735 RepID=A0AA42CNQ8_9HYPH|nr:ferritin-like domain-containing protein [Lichenifustis flavocetrariae]MCW6509647.1 ferritin-like domain-containing protein [Lichenifustis flavocetrariae]
MTSIDRNKPNHGSNSRRSILKWAGATAVAAVAFGVDVPGLRLSRAFAQAGVDLGAGDLGILNYAYALEQLEAAFYTQVLASPYGGMTRGERSLLQDIKAHEIAHRTFFARTLGGNRIPDLTPNFSAVDFSSKASVLGTAATFEDLGVAAYNGGGAAIQSPKILAAAGSIVSVEARHAATIHAILGDFGPVDQNGLDQALLPSQVLPMAAPFIATPVTASQLP